LRALEHAVALNGIDAKINQAEFEAKQFATAAGCVMGILGGVASGAGSGSSSEQSNNKAAAGGFGGMLGCMSGFAELGFLEQLRDLDDEKLGEELALVISQYSQRFANHAAALEKQSLALTEALEEVNRKLGDIETLRQAARRAVNDSLWVLSKRNHGPVTEVMKQRWETARVRYEQAFDHAKQMSFLAKRAIEQRLGMKLADLREDLPLVAAPQTWEGTVCATTGIDYNALRQPGDDKPNNYADAFIGDYVTKLENVVEAYRLRYNFHEGSDTAVVSLRDDILNVRQKCTKESENLLFHSSELGRAVDASEPSDSEGGSTDESEEVTSSDWVVRGVDEWPSQADPSSLRPPSGGLIGWWPLDGDGRDESGNGYHLSNFYTLGGPTVTATAGKVHQALQFDGSSCLIGSGSSGSSFSGAPGLTVMAWVKPSGKYLSSGNLVQSILVQGDDYGTEQLAFRLYHRDGLFAFATLNGFYENPYDQASAYLMGDQWALAAVTMQADGIYRIFINGQLSADLAFGSGWAWTFWQEDPFDVAPRYFTMGCLNGSSPLDTFLGALDEVSLYRRPLTASEIQAYYAATVGARTEPPVEVRETAGISVTTGLESRRLPTYTLTTQRSAVSGVAPPRLVQQVTLAPGRYRFSWHAPTSDVSESLGMSRVGYVDGTAIDKTNAPEASIPVARIGTPQWSRPSFTFELGQEAEIEIGWEAKSDGPHVVELAGAMLERVDSASDELPGPYEETTDVRELQRAVCEDTSGEAFRDRWTPGCVNLCPDGFSSDCSERAQEHCYHEVSFHVSQRGIEAGQIFNQAAFARGNFNYRIHSIALNFVGPNLRTCAESDLPNTCNAAGFVPYSLSHEGPYMVRNHKGDDFRARLFTGHIEHARGLGTERYITNPIGSADSEQLGQYRRLELKGRPLDGNFVLRVWDEPNLDFSAVKDVQLVLDYGYWTRFD
jgi:hypothetical protein